MGRADQSDSSRHSRKGTSKNKSKGRMSYLKRQRWSGGGRRGGSGGRGGGGGEAKEDELGQKYGDYEPAYGNRSWRSGGNDSGGRHRRPRESLRPGMKGFLCTTNFKERECVREAYNILNEYCEEEREEKKMVVVVVKEEDQEMVVVKEENQEMLAVKEEKQEMLAVKEEKQEMLAVKEEKQESDGAEAVGGEASDSFSKVGDDGRKTEEMAKPVKAECSRRGDDDEEDIDAALASELSELKSEKNFKKFQSVDTDVNNIVFISTTIENPTALAYRIFEDVTTKKLSKSRYLMRLMPIELTCNANNMDEVKARAKEVFEKYLKTGYSSFKIVANVRFNTKVKKDDLITNLAEVVSQINPLTFVDLNNPKYTIVAEVMKTNLCLGIVEEYTKFRKYNLLEAGIPPPQASDETTAKASDADQTESQKDADANITDEPVRSSAEASQYQSQAQS